MQCLKEARRAELRLAFVLSQVLETCERPRAGRASDGAALGARAAYSAVAVAAVPAVPSFASETAVTGFFIFYLFIYLKPRTQFVKEERSRK